jgi:outer membrane protein OmpA-like peptidoglycan-associated protein
LRSAEDAPLRLGVIGGVQRTFHETDFAELPEVPCCNPGYSSAKGLGAFGAAILDVPLGHVFSLQPLFGVSSDNATLSTEEQRVVNLNGEAYDGRILHELKTSAVLLTVDALVAARIVGGLRLGVGPSIMIPLSASYTKSETLLEPEGLVWENGSTVRENGSGSLGLTSPMFAITGTLSYEFAVSDRITFMPMVMGSLPLTQYEPSVSWYVTPIRAGIAIMVGPSPHRPIAPIPPSPPAPIPPSIAACSIATAVTVEGVASDRIVLKQKELIKRDVKPLLPAVFFAENSARIPMRYALTTDTASFQERQLHSMTALAAHHEVLNVIGKRMKADPTARITITGCRSQSRDEATDTTLSRQRAETVRDHLTSVWGISPDRMKLMVRGLPAVPSNEDDEDGIAENRRVEIDGDEHIVGSIWTVDTTRELAPVSVTITPTVQAPHGVSQWRYSIIHGDTVKTVRTFGPDVSIPNVIEWDVAADAEKILDPSWTSVLLSFTFADSNGRWTTSDEVELPIERVRAQRDDITSDGREFTQFSIIGFDFNSADLDQQARTLLDRIAPYIAGATNGSITGLTDRIGSPTRNATLSLERARAVANHLGSDLPVRGLGSGMVLYDNDLPEGRFHSRTVLIEVWK